MTFENMSQKVNELSLRERAISLAVLIVSTVVVYLQFHWAAGLEELEVLTKDAQRLEASQVRLRKMVDGLNDRLKDDPNSPMRVQNRQLLNELESQEAQLVAVLGHLVKPEDVVDLLQQVLKEGDGIRVRRLRSLPVTQIFATEDEDKTGLYAHLYSHRVQIDLEASFFSTLGYLRRLEALKGGLLFKRLEYEVDNYPKATVVLTVETIGLDKEWLGV